MSSRASYDLDSARTPWGGIILAVSVGTVLSGAVYLLSFAHRSLTWILWMAMIWTIYRFSKELPLGRLIRPVLPYLLWLVFYLVWGVIVAPNTDFVYAGKVIVTTVIFAMAMAILTAKPQYLRIFANIVQFAVVANLILWFLAQGSPKVSRIIMEATYSAEPSLLTLNRFGGLFGNANMLGYVCLVSTILSVFATPWISWLGRISCLPLLYLTASRKTSILYLVVFLLYIIIVQRRNLKFWFAGGAAAIFLASLFLLNSGLREKTHAAAKDPVVSRLLDVQEKHTVETGGETRADLLFHWVSTLHEAPWYGYGLKTMAGTIYDDVNPDKVLMRGPYPKGSHNTYLGVWVEIGPVGFIAFLVMLLHYVRLCFTSGQNPDARWALISFMLINLAILFVSHSHLFCFEGKIAFTLLFLLPTSPGLRGMGLWQARQA